jgi:hypothetical protein
MTSFEYIYDSLWDEWRTDCPNCTITVRGSTKDILGTKLAYHMAIAGCHPTL